MPPPPFPSLCLLLSPSPSDLLTPSLPGAGKIRSVLPCSLRPSRASTSTRLEAPYGVAGFIPPNVRSRLELFESDPSPSEGRTYSRRSWRRFSWIDHPPPPMFVYVSRDALADDKPSRLFRPGTLAASCRSDGIHEQIIRAQSSTSLQSRGSAKSSMDGLEDRQVAMSKREDEGRAYMYRRGLYSSHT